MLLTKLKVYGWVAALSLALAGVAYAQIAGGGAQKPRPGNPVADEIQALRLEIEALRLDLKATRERVKQLEVEVKGPHTTSASSASAPKDVTVDGDGRRNVRLASPAHRIAKTATCPRTPL